MSKKLVQQQHHARDTMGQFLNPDNGYRGSLARKGVQPKDHMRENLKDMRVKQMELRMKKEEEARPSKPLYKLPQFKDVESRLYEGSSGKENTPRRRSSFDDESNRQFLTKGQSGQRREELAREKRAIRDEIERRLEEERNLAEIEQNKKPSVPKSNEIISLRGPSNADFISRNKMNAMTMQSSKRENDDNEDYRHDEFGRVPQYLEQRKNQWAEEEAEIRRQRPDPNCPPGMKLMPEEERLSTLETLQQSREEAMIQLRRLPFVIETPSMRKKQEFLENKLREIDRALDIFNKPKVYVAFD
jgi:hypothetical protein